MNMYKDIDPYEYMNTIMQGVKKGVLLTTKKDAIVNTMTISWGQMGIEWDKLIFTTYVRTGRFTHEQLENGEFSINIPTDRNKAGKILGYAGTKSGYNTNKIKDLGLTLVEGKNISVPGIRECPLTLECRVIYKQLQDSSAISRELIESMYPQNVDSDFHGSNKDFHTMFYGEIVSAYILD